MVKPLLFLLCGSLVMNGLAAWAVSPAEVPLQRTALAPLGAEGIATLDSLNNRPALDVSVVGLLPGAYRFSAIRRRDHGLILLGTITVEDPSLSPDREANDNRQERSTVYASSALWTRSQVILPPGLAPADIVELDVANSRGVLLLSGKPPAPLKGKT